MTAMTTTRDAIAAGLAAAGQAARQADAAVDYPVPYTLTADGEAETPVPYTPAGQ